MTSLERNTNITREACGLRHPNLKNLKNWPLPSYTHQHDDLPSKGEVQVSDGDSFSLCLTACNSGFWHCPCDLHRAITRILLVCFPCVEVLFKPDQTTNTGSAARKQPKTISLSKTKIKLHPRIQSVERAENSDTAAVKYERPSAIDTALMVGTAFFSTDSTLTGNDHPSSTAVPWTVLHWLSLPMSKPASARLQKPQVVG